MQVIANPFGISERIDELIKNIAEMEKAINSGKKSIDLIQVKFVTPLSILPLAVYANNNELTINCLEEDEDVCRYLETIGFQEGVADFSKAKKYLPITKMVAKEADSEMLSEYENRIIKEMNVEKTALKYFTSEIINNVNEHAHIDNYWLLAQYYKKPKVKTCEIVIADCGIGYKKSYKGTEYEAKTDDEAIINAFKGKSSKKDWKGRGNGIQSISKLCVNGFGGKMIIMSGKALVYHKADETKILKLKSGWDGSLVALNFTPKDIEIYKFVS